MEPRGASDIDGQTERSIWVGAHESKRGQRMSFNDAARHFERVHVNTDRVENGADGFSDIEHVAIGNRAGRRQRS